MPSVIPNKIKYGLNNVYYAKVITNSGANGEVVTYETPKRIPGAVSVSLKSKGENTSFYADDIEYFNISNSSGYEGDIEFALIPDEFRVVILGDSMDDVGVIFENADTVSSAFALLFEFSGDAHKTRHVIYNCKCSRPDVESGTKTEKIEPKTEKLTLSCLPAADTKMVKAKCDTSSSAYNDWFKSVYAPAVD